MKSGGRAALAAVVTLLLLAPAAGMVHVASAQASSSLAARYAPVLHFASGEKFYPTSVDYILSSSTLVTRNPDGSLATVDASPTPSTLGSYTDTSMFLYNRLGNLTQIAADYAANAQGKGYFAYVHIVNGTSATVIQYWLFYAYNNGPLNDHQADIEVVEVFLDGSGNPTQALYSQHLAGENAAWSDVEMVGGHPVVYVALGSHANYFRSYQGRIGLENDVVNGGGLTITPDQLNLVSLHDPSDRPASQSWLGFPGRWGFVGTDTQVATGMAGPYGPVYNDNGQRWASPEAYLGRTLAVGGYYFDLALLAANFLLIFAVYAVARGALKLLGIVRLKRKGGLNVMKFLRGRGGLGAALGLAGVAVTVAALFLPWYSVSASSQSGPLAGGAPVTLMSVDGINGLAVNLFLGPSADSTSGLTSFASAQLPFAIMIGAGLALLLLDLIGVRKGRKFGNKLIFGAVTSLLPFVFIVAFVEYLPNLVPLAQSLFGQPVPASVNSMVSAMASSPVTGSGTSTFPVVGATTVNWGFGIGAYLFVVAAAMRIVGGFVCRSAPPLEETGDASPPPAVVPATPTTA